jgi:hypothetical protein
MIQFDHGTAQKRAAARRLSLLLLFLKSRRLRRASGLRPFNNRGRPDLREHALQIGEFKFELVRSLPRQIPSARAPNSSDVRTTLSVCVESAIRAAIAVLGTPPALSNSTALRKYHGGDTEDGRDNECSKHDFISVWSWVYRSATTPRSRQRRRPGDPLPGLTHDASLP